MAIASATNRAMQLSCRGRSMPAELQPAESLCNMKSHSSKFKSLNRRSEVGVVSNHQIDIVATIRGFRE